MRAIRLLSLALACAATLAARRAAADTVASWTFDADRQGWDATYPSNTGTASLYQSSGGNPGGFLEATDRTGFQVAGPWYFVLNQSPTVDYSAAYGGTLSFDLKSFAPAGTPFASNDVILQGGGLVIETDAGVQPTSAWSTFTVNLSEGTWRTFGFGGSTTPTTQAQFQAVLASFQDLQIRGDYTTGTGTTPGSAGFDVTGLDNVVIASPAAPAVAPLPSTAWAGLGLLGCLGTAQVVRRRKAATV